MTSVPRPAVERQWHHLIHPKPHEQGAMDGGRVRRLRPGHQQLRPVGRTQSGALLTDLARTVPLRAPPGSTTAPTPST